MAAILATLAEQDHQTVAGLCARHQIPRSTAFQIVGKLLSAGFLTRQGKGRLTLGPEAVRLGYAGSDLAQLAGPGEAILSWLRTETGADVALLANTQPAIRLVSIPDRPIAHDIEVPVCDNRGSPVALVQVLCRKGATRAESAYALHCCQRAKESLETYLEETGEQS